MPVLHYTQHAYGTWMPDRPEGFVHHTRGLTSSHDDWKNLYRHGQREPAACFLPDVQELLIQTMLDACRHIDVRPHSAATERVHFHFLGSWRDEREIERIYLSLRRALTKALNNQFGRRTWFTKKSHRKRVIEARHFNYLVTEYHPSHPGWGWNESGGWREPVDGRTCGS